MKKLQLLSIIAFSALNVYAQGTTSPPPTAPNTNPAPAPTTAPASTAPPAPTTTTTTPTQNQQPASQPASTNPPSAPAPPASPSAPAAPASQTQQPSQSTPAAAPSSVAPATPAASVTPAAPASMPASTSASSASSDTKWKFGLHATPAIKWLSTSTEGVKSGGAKVGFSYGLVAEYFFGSRYSFCSGVDFCYRGGALKIESTGDKSNFNLQYVEVPVTIKMHTTQIEKKTFFAKFGVSPGWNTGHKGDELPDEGTSDFYIALKIGGGAEYEISDQTMIFAGLIWNNGFTDAFKSDQINAKNNAVELEIGILF